MGKKNQGVFPKIAGARRPNIYEHVQLKLCLKIYENVLTHNKRNNWRKYKTYKQHHNL
jgi:hypothetical protein